MTTLPYGSKEPLKPLEELPCAEQVCKCGICAYSAKVKQGIAARDPDVLIELVRELMNANYHVGMDLNYANTVLEGSWPSAVEQLERALRRARAFRRADRADSALKTTTPSVQCVVMHAKKALTRHLLTIGAVKKGNFTLSSGRQSDIYCETSLAALDATGLHLAVSCLDELLVPYNFDSIGVMEGAGSGVLLGGLLHHLGEGKGFVVRKEAKEHGTGKQVEGFVGKHFVIIDDVATSGKSLVHVISAMPVKPLVAAVLLDRQEGAAEALKPLGVPLISVLTLQDIRDFEV
jgi:orotate phosphoribosyltransferase